MIDPRAMSAEKIAPPAPLPYVSRRALLRIAHALPAPTVCKCGGQVELVNNSEIYGREYGEWPFAYWCRACDSMVGLHPNTDLPLGTLADKALRNKRNHCKRPFERIWREGLLSRTSAYAWLAQSMQLTQEQCHFGLFDAYQCDLARDLCYEFLEAAHA